MRVLLADESSTIKKAIQLVLSDYGVEIKAVPTGIDVLSVTQSFHPDIVIADVLLNKKNGYEVCLELKNSEETKNIPVILMWSSFMQLDEELFRNSKADASLEKPFETETIRELIEKLVPKLQTFPLKGLLNFAPLPDFEESDTFIRQKNDYNTLGKPENSVTHTPATFVIDEPTSFRGPGAKIQGEDDQAPKVASFKEKLLKRQTQQTQQTQQPTEPPPQPHQPQTKQPPEEKEQPENDEWSAAKTNQFVIETENFGDFEEVKVINSRNEEPPDLQKKINEEIQTYIKDSPVSAHRAQNSMNQKNPYSSFDEQLIKEEIRQIAERICWQVIPEITEKVVREELGKLLQGIENNI